MHDYAFVEVRICVSLDVLFSFQESPDITGWLAASLRHRFHQTIQQQALASRDNIKPS